MSEMLRPILLATVCMAFGSPVFAQLTAFDVEKVIKQATTRAGQISPNSVIAVTDLRNVAVACWLRVAAPRRISG